MDPTPAAAPRLLTLGRIGLETPSRSAAAPGGEKLLGLLAYLALEGREGGVARDRLLSLFWPESSASRAGGALRHLVHRARAVVGREGITVTREGMVALAPEALEVDAIELRQALEAGDLERAHALDAGELLPGFSVPGGGRELDRWVEQQRRDFRRDAASAYLRGLRAATAASRSARAARWAARAVAHAPFDEGLHREVISLLEKGANAALALRLYQELTARLEHDLGVPPSSQTRAVAERLRRRLLEPPFGRGEAFSGRRTVVVREFAEVGEVEPGLAERVTRLLALVLESPRLTVVRAVEDPAEGTADAVTVEGHLLASGEALRLQVAARGHDGALLSRHDVPLDAADTASATDRAAALLAADLTPLRAGRIAEVARAGAASPGALTEFLSGEEALGRGDFVTALDCFGRALARDGDFELARYRRAVAALWQHNLALARLEAGRVRRDRLPSPERDLMEGLSLFLDGHVDAAEAAYRAVIRQFPGAFEAWFLLGVLLFYHNLHRGRSWCEARPVLEHVLSVGRPDAATLLYLSSIAAWDGRFDELDRLTDRLLEILPPGSHPDYRLGVRAQRAFAIDDPVDQEAVLRDAAGATDLDLVLAATTATSVTRGNGVTLPLARELTTERRSPGARLRGHVYVAALEVAGGRTDRATVALEAARRIDPLHADEFGALLWLAPGAHASDEAPPPAWVGASLRPGQRRPTDLQDIPYAAPHAGVHFMVRPYLRGELAVRQGRLDEAAAALHELAEAADDDRVPGLGSSLTGRLRAAMAEASGEPERALAHLESSLRRVSPLHVYTSPLYSLAHARWRCARLLETLGRRDEAEAWDRSQGQVCATDAPFAAAVARR